MNRTVAVNRNPSGLIMGDPLCHYKGTSIRRRSFTCNQIISMSTRLRVRVINHYQSDHYAYSMALIMKCTLSSYQGVTQPLRWRIKHVSLQFIVLCANCRLKWTICRFAKKIKLTIIDHLIFVYTASLIWLNLVPGLMKPAPCYTWGDRTDQ